MHIELNGVTVKVLKSYLECIDDDFIVKVLDNDSIKFSDNFTLAYFKDNKDGIKKLLISPVF